MNPFDHYWLASDGRLYSSARQALVTEADTAFENWSEVGGRPTAWPRDNAGEETIAALQEVLTPYGLYADLAAYARFRSWQAETGGMPINGVIVATDRESQGLINGMYALAQRDADRTFKFDSLGGPVTLTAPEAIALAEAVGNHVQAAFDLRADVLARIDAGAITTIVEIDATFAALG